MDIELSAKVFWFRELLEIVALILIFIEKYGKK